MFLRGSCELSRLQIRTRRPSLTIAVKEQVTNSVTLGYTVGKNNGVNDHGVLAQLVVGQGMGLMQVLDRFEEMNSLVTASGGSLFGSMLVFRRVFGTATRKRIIRTAPWNRIAAATFVAHLRGQAAHA